MRERSFGRCGGTLKTLYTAKSALADAANLNGFSEAKRQL